MMTVRLSKLTLPGRVRNGMGIGESVRPAWETLSLETCDLVSVTCCVVFDSNRPKHASLTKWRFSKPL